MKETKRRSRILVRLIKSLFKPNELTSLVLRRLFYSGYNIQVGLYSYGCFDRDRFTPNMKIGRYCSFSQTCRRINANHPVQFLTMSPYLYNPRLGNTFVQQIERSYCEIEDDVWIGHNAIILPSVTHIGRGSIIAAGSIVTKNVGRYQIIAGNPGKVIRQRFTDDVIAKIERSEWWELDLQHIRYLCKNHQNWLQDPSTLPNFNLQEYFKGK